MFDDLMANDLALKGILSVLQDYCCEEKYFVAMRYMVYNCKYSKVFLKTVP